MYIHLFAYALNLNNLKKQYKCNHDYVFESTILTGINQIKYFLGFKSLCTNLEFIKFMIVYLSSLKKIFFNVWIKRINLTNLIQTVLKH